MENFSSSNELFTIDLSASLTPADVVFELSQYLDDSNSFGKKIYLKLAKIDLSQAQLLSLQSLINSINSTLTYIESPSDITINSAQTLGIATPNHADFEQITESSEEVQQQTENNNLAEREEELSQAEIEARKYINMQMFTGEDKEFEALKQQNEVEHNYQQPLFDNNEIEQNESSEQELDDFAPRYQEGFKENNEEQESQEIIENPDQQKFDIVEDFIGHEEVEAAEENNIQEENNVLDNIEPSVEFNELAQNTNVQNDEVQDAIGDIFDAEQKLSDILVEGEEKLTIELAEPLDNTYTEEDAQIEGMNVKYVKQTIRSGNVITSDGNLVIIGDCHPGSEIHAAGDVTVWGILGGIVHAGNKGNTKAKVRALKLNPIQLRIANLYSRRPDSLHTICVEKTSTFTPEEARILNNEIIIYTMNEK